MWQEDKDIAVQATIYQATKGILKIATGESGLVQESSEEYQSELKLILKELTDLLGETKENMLFSFNASKYYLPDIQQLLKSME